MRRLWLLATTVLLGVGCVMLALMAIEFWFVAKGHGHVVFGAYAAGFLVIAVGMLTFQLRRLRAQRP